MIHTDNRGNAKYLKLETQDQILVWVKTVLIQSEVVNRIFSLFNIMFLWQMGLREEDYLQGFEGFKLFLHYL